MTNYLEVTHILYTSIKVTKNLFCPIKGIFNFSPQSYQYKCHETVYFTKEAKL